MAYWLFKSEPNTWGWDPMTRILAVPRKIVAKSINLPTYNNHPSNLFVAHRDTPTMQDPALIPVLIDKTNPRSHKLTADGRYLFVMPPGFPRPANGDSRRDDIMLKNRWGKPAKEHDRTNWVDIKPGENNFVLKPH